MPDYKEMYHQLFRAQTEAIEILQKAQQKTEQIYISAPESDAVLLMKKSQKCCHVGEEATDVEK